MQNSRKFVQTVRLFLVASVFAYAFVVWRLPSKGAPNRLLFLTITGMAVFLILIMFVMRRRLVFRAEAILVSHPEDPKALGQWRQGYLVCYILSEAIVMYGVALHFLGYSLSQVLPFFIVGLALLFFFAPKVPNREFPVADPDNP